MSNMILVGKILVGIYILLPGLFSTANMIVIFPSKKLWCLGEILEFALHFILEVVQLFLKLFPNFVRFLFFTPLCDKLECLSLEVNPYPYITFINKAYCHFSLSLNRKD
jgi:hypothetical protein